jgi:hypothetical protein
MTQSHLPQRTQSHIESGRRKVNPHGKLRTYDDDNEETMMTNGSEEDGESESESEDNEKQERWRGDDGDEEGAIRASVVGPGMTSHNVTCIT